MQNKKRQKMPQPNGNLLSLSKREKKNQKTLKTHYNLWNDYRNYSFLLEADNKVSSFFMWY